MESASVSRRLMVIMKNSRIRPFNLGPSATGHPEPLARDYSLSAGKKQRQRDIPPGAPITGRAACSEKLS